MSDVPSSRDAANEMEGGSLEAAPQVMGASTFDASSCDKPRGMPVEHATGATFPATSDQEGNTSETLGWWDLDYYTGLWGGGWDELVNEDAEQIGEVYEAGVLGSILGDGEEEVDFKSSSGEQAPAPARRKDTKKMSAKGLISNMVLSIIGSTTLGLAAQMKTGGWFLPPLMVCISAAIVAENTWLVCQTIDKMQAETGIAVTAYPDFALGAFGLWGKRLASVTSMFALVGMVCAFLVIESQNFSIVCPIQWPWFGCTQCSRKWWALFLMPVTILYVFGNPGALLKRTAFLGPVISLMTVVLAWTGAGSGIVTSLEVVPESCRASRIAMPEMHQMLTPNTWLQLAQIGSYGFFSFAVIVTVPTLRSQMKDVKKTAPASIFAYFLTLLMFLPIMLLGYAAYGNLVPDNLIDGMRDDRPAGWWALNEPWETGDLTLTGMSLDVVVTINLLMTEAIYLPCAILAIESSFPGLFREGPAWPRTVMRWGFIAFRFLVATEVNSFIAMSSLVSSLFCVCNNILLPILAFHHTKPKEVSSTRKLAHALMFVYGIFILALGTYSSAEAMSPEAVLAEAPGAHLRHGLSADCQAAFLQATNRSSLAG